MPFSARILQNNTYLELCGFSQEDVERHFSHEKQTEQLQLALRLLRGSRAKTTWARVQRADPETIEKRSTVYC
jgi:hypothetical protein